MLRFLVTFFKSLQVLVAIKNIFNKVKQFILNVNLLNHLLGKTKLFLGNTWVFVQKYKTEVTYGVILTSLLFGGYLLFEKNPLNKPDYKRYNVVFKQEQPKDYFSNSSGKLSFINPNLILGKLIYKDTIIYKLDTSLIDSQIQDLQSKFPELTGDKTIVQQDIITPPDNINILKYRFEIEDALANISYYESLESTYQENYNNMLDLYNKNIITQNELDNTLIKLQKATKNKNQAQYKYKLYSSLLKDAERNQTKKQIVITTTGAEDIRPTISALNKQIDMLQNQRDNSIYKSKEQGYLCGLYIKKEDTIKINQKIYTLCSSGYLVTNIKLSNKQLKDIKKYKVTLMDTNKNQSVSIDNLKFENNNLFVYINAFKINNEDKYMLILETK